MTRLALPLLALLAASACAPSASLTDEAAVSGAPMPAPPTMAASGGVDHGFSAEQIAFLDTLQHRTFRWFWDKTDPETGLTPDRWPTESFSSIAAIGYGLTGYGIGAERGYVTRQDAAQRTLNTLRTLYTLPQGPQQVGTAGHRGYFYHFLEYDTGTRFLNTELSSIDTALMMAGVLFSREYFDGESRTERDIRATADSLYQRVEWDFFDRPDPDDPRLTMGWYPEVNFGRYFWEGYNEGMILYILGLGSPTHPLPETVWPAWTETYEWKDFYGYEHVNFSPLFGHQYSHLFVDFRGIQDGWMRDRAADIGAGYDYFENSRRATLSQREYAIDNPNGWHGYGADVWGLTASDGPADGQAVVNGETRRFRTYWARGASAEYVNDDGTLAPTALGGSIPFAPQETVRALMTMAERFPALWTETYGFRDAVNPSLTAANVGGLQIKNNSEITPQGWVDHDYLGIDQGPILIMAENARTGLVWETLKKSPYIVRGLQRAGFQGGWLDGARAPAITPLDFPPSASVSAAGERRLVVVLGSSTAEGYGPSDSDSTWVNRLRVALADADPALDVLNLARGGYTTYHVMPEGTTVPETLGGAPDPRRNIDAALARDPVAILIGLTSNDSAYGHTAEEQIANFERLAQIAEAAGVPLYVTTTAPRALDAVGTQRQRDVRDWILDRFGDRAVDVWSGVALPDGTLDPRFDSGDDVHQNNAGHRLIFQRVLATDLLEEVAE